MVTKEEKFLLILEGVFKICAVRPDNWKTIKKFTCKRFVMNANSPKILHIPGGYAHGLR